MRIQLNSFQFCCTGGLKWIECTFDKSHVLPRLPHLLHVQRRTSSEGRVAKDMYVASEGCGMKEWQVGVARQQKLSCRYGESKIFRASSDGVTRNKVVNKKVTCSMKEMGYDYNWKQCRTKVKNPTQTYGKVHKVA